ncbi:MAG: hypothetical protein M3178_14600 [Pseudomonadota bacterium]|nr:hypothetical protein [Pseudomonadota bacterium]
MFQQKQVRVPCFAGKGPSPPAGSGDKIAASPVAACTAAVETFHAPPDPRFAAFAEHLTFSALPDHVESRDRKGIAQIQRGETCRNRKSRATFLRTCASERSEEDIARTRREGKTHHLADKTFHDRDALNAEIEAGVQDMNSKSKTQALVKLRISA